MPSPTPFIATAVLDLAQHCQVETTSFKKIDDVKPEESFELNITLSLLKSADDSIDVDVSLEGLSAEPLTWSVPRLPEPNSEISYRLALFPGESHEVTFNIKADPAAPPKLVNYQIVVRQANQGTLIKTVPLKLRILPVDRSKVSIDNPTFSFQPAAPSNDPLKVSSLGPTPIQVWVDNHSERVDRFQLRCEGLPKDWDFSIQYLQMALGTGLMLPATGLGLNPRDRGHIQLIIKPSPTAHAGIYTPTLRVISANNPALTLLHLLYLEIEPIYQLQPSLNSLCAQFRQGPGRFELQLVNNGNTSRQLSVEVESLEEVERHDYRLKRRSRFDSQPQSTDPSKASPSKEKIKESDLKQIDLKILPQQTRFVELEVEPKHRWRRPMVGGGYLSNFRINVADAEAHSITPATFQGNTTWMARPWWQLLLAVLLVLGLLGSAAGLIWWFFLRPPAVLSLTPSASKYSAVTNDFAAVDFKLRYANNIRAIRLTGYDSEGKISSAPIAYDFQDLAEQNKMQTDALPHGLKSLCTVQPRRRLLSCNRVHTGASLPGEYVFELDVIHDRRGEPSTLSEKTVPVAIAPIPGPAIVPNELIFQEPLIPTSPDELAAASKADISLNLEVFQPEKYQSLTLIGKTSEGKVFQQESYSINLPDAQSQYSPTLIREGDTEPPLINCKASPKNLKLTCPNVPTTIQKGGTFHIEAVFGAEDTAKTTTVTAISEPITITPAPIAINKLVLTANGSEGNLQPSSVSEAGHVASYVFFVDPKKFSPAKAPEVAIEWDVSGGASMEVALLLPSIQRVGEANKTQGRYPLLLTPGERKTVTLQVTDANGNTQAKSIEIEAVGPDPMDIAEATGKALADALKENAEREASAQEANGAPALGEDPTQPSELPPRFN